MHLCKLKQVGFTNGSEKFLNNVERYALVVASMGNVTDGEQQYMYRQRKSRSHIGENKDHMLTMIISILLLIALSCVN